MIPLANSAAWTVLIDIIFLLAISMGMAWYFYFHNRKNIIGGFIGATTIATLGALILFAFMHNSIRDLFMWLMSPKIGTVQLSNMNLIVVTIGAFLSLYFVDLLQNRKLR
ncbi:MAG: hypothetical protein H7A24_07270 [Leptospiraceae bacterium]|nr:hypothetical protein [Leptospiraceae bacterium]MCP5511665.1 hypothetical protein [Leptospiraceae bacterium]